MPSILDSCRQDILNDFEGADLLRDEEDTTGAILAENVTYLPGIVQTRAGFFQAFNPNVAISTLFDWIQSTIHRLLYFHSGTTVISRNLATGVEDTILTGLSAQAMSAAIMGSRVWMAFFDAGGNGVTEGRVWDGLFTGGAEVDKLFQRPLLASEFSIAASEPTNGTVTPGSHRFAIMFTTRNGFEVPPSPGTGGLTGLSPLSFTTTGGKNLRITVTPVGTWPAFLRAGGNPNVQVLMTTAQNPNRYFKVPGAQTTVAGGSALAASVDFDINDAMLALGTDVTRYFSILTMGSGNTGPFSPSVILEYNNRAVYITQIFDSNLIDKVSAIYISDQYAPQWITADQHVVQMPGFRQVMTAFVLGNVIYWLGPEWTYASRDNGAVPAAWPAARLVDGRIGTKSPYGVSVNPSRGLAFVADQAGLYVFTGGVYPNLPISYKQTPDWKRINWATAGSKVIVKDDPTRNTVRVLVPLDGSTVPNFIMSFDYTNGYDYESVKYSRDYLGDASAQLSIIGATNATPIVITTSTVHGYSTGDRVIIGGVGGNTAANGNWIVTVLTTTTFSLNTSAGNGSYTSGGIANRAWNPGAIEIVRNETSKIMELWIGRSIAGPVLRLVIVAAGILSFDSALYNDNGTGISSIYRCKPMPQWLPIPIQHHGGHIRIRGTGVATVKVWSADQARSIALSNIVLSNNPGKDALRLFKMQSEAAFWEISNNGAIANAFWLARIAHYSTPWISRR